MKSRVLVIDDERSLCEVVKQGLELLGEARFAASGDATLQTWIYEEIGRCYGRLRNTEKAEALKRFLQSAARH